MNHWSSEAKLGRSLYQVDSRFSKKYGVTHTQFGEVEAIQAKKYKVVSFGYLFFSFFFHSSNFAKNWRIGRPAGQRWTCPTVESWVLTVFFSVFFAIWKAGPKTSYVTIDRFYSKKVQTYPWHSQRSILPHIGRNRTPLKKKQFTKIQIHHIPSLFGEDMDVSENNSTSKSSILIGFSIINHPFWGTPIFGIPHIFHVLDALSRLPFVEAIPWG